MNDQGGPSENLSSAHMRRSWYSVLAVTTLGLGLTVACFVVAGVTETSTPVGFAVLGCFFTGFFALIAWGTRSWRR